MEILLEKEQFIPVPSGSVTVWHSLFHLSYIYDNVVYERNAKNIKIYQKRIEITKFIRKEK